MALAGLWRTRRSSPCTLQGLCLSAFCTRPRRPCRRPRTGRRAGGRTSIRRRRGRPGPGRGEHLAHAGGAGGHRLVAPPSSMMQWVRQTRPFSMQMPAVSSTACHGWAPRGDGGGCGRRRGGAGGGEQGAGGEEGFTTVHGAWLRWFTGGTGRAVEAAGFFADVFRTPARPSGHPWWCGRSRWRRRLRAGSRGPSDRWCRPR